MKFFLCLFLLVIIAAAGLQVYRLTIQRADLAREISKFDLQASALEAEQGGLLKDILYFQNERNVLKEFKSKFNYRSPEEKMIILVPRTEGSQ